MTNARTFRNDAKHLFLFSSVVETFKVGKSDSIDFLDVIPDITNRNVWRGQPDKCL